MATNSFKSHQKKDSSLLPVAFMPSYKYGTNFSNSCSDTHQRIWWCPSLGTMCPPGCRINFSLAEVWTSSYQYAKESFGNSLGQQHQYFSARVNLRKGMNYQFDLFGQTVKSNNAVKHDRLRSKQSDYLDSHHHPQEKLNQLIKLDNYIYGDILELFAGQGNLSEHYKQKGALYQCTKETTGDSFQHLFELISNKKCFDVVDIDSYGYPSQFMDNVWHVMKPTSTLIITFPVMGVQCINGIVEQHFINFWKSARPTTGDVVGAVTDYGLKYWYLPKLVDVVKIKPIWRFVFQCARVKATEFCTTRNR